MKETTDPKTGVKELQPAEHVPVGPVQIVDNGSIGPLKKRIDNLTIVVDSLGKQIATLKDQIRSLQMQGAASIPGLAKTK